MRQVSLVQAGDADGPGGTERPSDGSAYCGQITRIVAGAPTRHAVTFRRTGHHLRQWLQRVTVARHRPTTRTANAAVQGYREASRLVHCSHSVTEVHSRRIPGRDVQGGHHVGTATVTETLTAADRCDRCGARAYIRVLLPAGGELLFCAHHGRTHATALEAVHASIQDQSHGLASTPAIAPDGEI
jgi:hypothetical protein